MDGEGLTIDSEGKDDQRLECELFDNLVKTVLDHSDSKEDRPPLWTMRIVYSTRLDSGKPGRIALFDVSLRPFHIQKVEIADLVWQRTAFLGSIHPREAERSHPGDTLPADRRARS
jgi:hypothetical protein